MKSVTTTYTRWDHVETATFAGEAGYSFDRDLALARLWGGGKTLIVPKQNVIAIEVEE